MFLTLLNALNICVLIFYATHPTLKQTHWFVGTRSRCQTADHTVHIVSRSVLSQIFDQNGQKIVALQLAPLVKPLYNVPKFTVLRQIMAGHFVALFCCCCCCSNICQCICTFHFRCTNAKRYTTSTKNFSISFLTDNKRCLHVTNQC